MKAEKQQPLHYDILGREVKVGDFICFDSIVWKVTKVSPKMVTGARAKQSNDRWSRHSNTKHIYANCSALLPEQDVLMWILKHQ